MITRGLKDSPTANLEFVAGIQPISLKIEENEIKTALRLKLTRNWDKFYQFQNKSTISVLTPTQ